VAAIPAVLLLIQVVAAVFGYNIDFGDLGNKLLRVVDAAFAVLTLFGIINDPTTPGISDSERALSYVAPGVTATTGTTTVGVTTDTDKTETK
jgi:phi LC3 family holin